MTVEESIRQADVGEGRLTVEETDTGVVLRGAVDLDELVMAVLGSVAGGP